MTGFPQVQGRCPACRRTTLILGAGGHVTCAHLDCRNPAAASDLLEQQVTAGVPLICSDERHEAKVRGLQAERDGAYRERAQLVALLAALYPAVLAPDLHEPGWQILYLTAGGRQLSWHIAPSDADLFSHVAQVGADDLRAQWDKHTTEEKYQRIRQLYASPAGLFGGDRCEITLDVITGGRKFQTRRVTPLVPFDMAIACAVVAAELRAMAAEVEALTDPQEAQ